MKTRKDSGRLVAQLRKTIGKSQSQFAAMIGVSKHTIISVENGRNKLSRNLARRIQMATGAEILDETLSFEPVIADYNALPPEARKFMRRRWDGTGKYDNLYTGEDFEQWRTNFFSTNDEAARKLFDKIKKWVEFLFRAAAKPGVAGNRDRLPAVYQSLVEWLNQSLEHFKLRNEVDDILEQETHSLGEQAYSISSLQTRQDLDRIKDEFASYGFNYDQVKKSFKKAKPGDWIVLETETRNVWHPFNDSFFIPCATRTLRPKPKFWFANGIEYFRKMGFTTMVEPHAKSR
jgi:DNA-binding XRE family transcriptional regulator